VRCGTIRAVRLSRVLLPVSAAAGALSVLTALFSAWQAALLGGVVALAALVGYAAVAGRAAAPRVRWAVTAGLGLLAVVMAARLFWYPEQTAAVGWLAPFYPPLDGGGRAPGKAALLDHWQRMISRERLAAVGQLLAVLCFAVAVLALPTRPRPKRAVLTAVLALLLLAGVAENVWRQLAGGRVLDLLSAAWPALLATVLAVVVAILSGWRASRSWQLPVGALLVALAAVTSVGGIVSTWSSSWALTESGAVDTMSVAITTVRLPDVSAALATAVALSGPALLAVGALRAARDASALRRS
jgi:hypothetical protein